MYSMTPRQTLSTRLVDGATFLSPPFLKCRVDVYLDVEGANADAKFYTDFVPSWKFASGPVPLCLRLLKLVKKYHNHPDGVTEAQRDLQEYL
ncbi:hypothetical protein CY34DRAFT_532167 [Suillus luteus UH-Slu-Lm8-n1]|uniref:Uncharacterized protein n=1 Tax=Suillus luteus UH-Slu-Lm8-n1 TaxID=930992 RepID=A0A0D0AWL5_9AGAM|nr:hypothetical protein CY34DRAFT_532167 [Suillus luteus UH-Slu-Lm8-n1]